MEEEEEEEKEAEGAEEEEEERTERNFRVFRYLIIYLIIWLDTAIPHHPPPPRWLPTVSGRHIKRAAIWGNVPICLKGC